MALPIMGGSQASALPAHLVAAITDGKMEPVVISSPEAPKASAKAQTADVDKAPKESAKAQTADEDMSNDGSDSSSSNSSDSDDGSLDSDTKRKIATVTSAKYLKLMAYAVEKRLGELGNEDQ